MPNSAPPHEKLKCDLTFISFAAAFFNDATHTFLFSLTFVLKHRTPGNLMFPIKRNF